MKKTTNFIVYALHCLFLTLYSLPLLEKEATISNNPWIGSLFAFMLVTVIMLVSLAGTNLVKHYKFLRQFDHYPKYWLQGSNVKSIAYILWFLVVVGYSNWGPPTEIGTMNIFILGLTASAFFYATHLKEFIVQQGDAFVLVDQHAQLKPVKIRHINETELEVIYLKSTKVSEKKKITNSTMRK